MIGRFFRTFRRSEPSILDTRPQDAAALAAVHALTFRHGWSELEFERLLSDRAVIGHVARAPGGGGSVVGFVLSRLAADEAEILVIAVAPAGRSRGLAGRLLRRHLQRLATLGVSRVFLEVDEGNDTALRLYARAGFQEIGRRAGYYRRPEGEAAALMLRRDLA
jgi:ribosomal-protein-alanine N-acetyltransferase